ncbi:MAG: CotH kinase family protein, partial [Syntrophothermus sp.]
MSRYWCFLIISLCFYSNHISPQGKYLRINEFMASNVLTLADNTGEYEDWIEIYNSGDTPVDLAGYYFTDDPARINVWKIPAGQPGKTTVPSRGYLILWADKAPDRGADHIGFKLPKDKGQISLLDKDGISLLDNIAYKQQQFRDISAGSFPDGTGQFCYSSENTPGKSNKTGYAGFCMPVSIDLQAGFYNNSITVSVQALRTGDIIRYTLDGSDPIESSPLYSGPVTINATSVFKARAFNSGDLPGVITARTYFINKAHSLPVMAMIIDPKNLYDPATGIYVNDKDGRAWERYSELEYFTDRALVFHSPAGQRIQGNTGPKDFEKKSFRSYFRDGYGQDKIRNVFYPYDTLKAFNRIVLRAGYDDSMLPAAGGADTKSTLLRDPLITEFWRQSGELTSHSKFTVLYLNEKFHGIYDIKESIDENFIKDHLGYSDLDMMRTRYDSTELVYGTRDTWINLVKFFENNSFESETMYSEAAKMMDLDNFIDLQALVHGAQYSTWSYGTFMYREKTDNAKFRWSIWDADKAYLDVNYNAYTSQSSPIGTWLDNLITKKLFKNKEFRTRFQNRLCDLLNTVFEPANALKIIDSLAQHISPEIPNEVTRWPNSEAKWKENVELMRNFARQRAGIVLNQTKNYFQLGGISDVKLEVNAGRGKVIINSVIPKNYPWAGRYFTGVPVIIKAVPDPGYIFIGWTDSRLPQKESITFSPDGATTFAAIFAKAGNAFAEVIAPKRIKAGMYFPYIVRVRSSNWSIDPLDQTPFQISFASAHADTVIKIKRGAGTGLSKIDYTQPFLFTVQNANTAAVIKQTTVSDIPVINYSGILPAGVITWDSSAERVITSDLTIPAGCTLNIKQG